MTRNEGVALAAAGALLLALALAAGPKAAAGAALGLPVVVLVLAHPLAGLGLMILSGTALQVLGSEHLTGLPMSLGKLAGGLTLVAWLLRIATGRDAMTFSPQFLALLGFLASLVLSVVISPDRALAADGLFRYAQILLLYFMVANLAAGSERALDATCWALTLSMTVSVFIALAEFTLPSLSLDYDDASLVQGAIGAILDQDSIAGVTIKRVTGGLSDSNWFGYTLAGTLPVNLYLFGRYRAASVRLLVSAIAALQVFGVVLSLTRVAFFATAVSGLVLLGRRRLPLAPVLLAGLAGAVAVVLWNPPGLQRMFSAQYLQAGSTPLRAMLVEGGAHLVAERPILGYGYGQFGTNFVAWLSTVSMPPDVALWKQTLTDRVAEGLEQVAWVMPHNTILQVWIEEGLLGIASFALFGALCLRDLALAARLGTPDQGLLADCLAAALCGIAVSLLFNHLALIKIVWILAGLAAALRRRVLATPAGASAALPRSRLFPAPGTAS